MRVGIVERAIDATALLREVASISDGASVLFVGTVREVNNGRPVTGLDYRAYSTMAGAELSAIALEAEARWTTPEVSEVVAFILADAKRPICMPPKGRHAFSDEDD